MQKTVVIWALALGIAIQHPALSNQYEASGVEHPESADLHTSSGSTFSEERSKKSPLDQLASEISGTIVYSRHHHVYKIVIGDWKPIELGEGEYARWSSDGEKIAVYDRRKIYVMDTNGSNRRLVTDEGWSKHGCPIEFHTNSREIIFIRRGKRGLWAVDIFTGEIRKLADFHDYTGEPGISEDGTRIACRVASTAYAIDLVNKRDFRYVKALVACSSGISPDGKWLINNRMGNIAMDIRSWDGKEHRVLRASMCQPDEEWDNHHWSNHNDYICTQGGKRGNVYVIKVSAKRCTRVTSVGRAVYPDLYVSDDSVSP